MDNVVYPELKIQDYLLSEDISTAEKMNLFHFRTRMASFSDNYRDGSNQPIPCKMCGFHRDCQEHSVTCHATMANVTHRGKYLEIFSSKISRETATMLMEIMNNRQEKNSWAVLHMGKENMPTRPMCTIWNPVTCLLMCAVNSWWFLLFKLYLIVVGLWML